MTLQRQQKIIHFTCDECGERLDTGTDDFEEARGELRQASWQTKKEEGVWCHYCPDCLP